MFRHLLAVVWIVAPLVAFATSPGAILAGHPAYPIVLTGVLVVGVALLVRARHTRHRPASRSLLVRVGAVLTALATTVVAVTVVVTSWPNPPHANAVAAMAGSPSVAVAQDTDTIALTPRSGSPTTGIVFQPGARTDARSYVPILTRLAERGHLVVIAKQPMSIAPLAQGRTREAMEAHPTVRAWVGIGHSFGGVPTRRLAASGDPRVAGVVLWATYADPDFAPPVPALVLYGAEDKAVPPAQASAPDSERVRYVAVDGATHTSFSDYGPAFGDGTETRPHTLIQADIVDLTDDFVRSVSDPRP